MRPLPMAADPADAIHEAPGGVRIDIDVTPGAAEDRFPDGYDTWRRRLGCRVRAAARDGAANDAVQRLVAARLGVDRSAVTLVRGATARQKTLAIAGVARADVLGALQGSMP